MSRRTAKLARIVIALAALYFQALGESDAAAYILATAIWMRVEEDDSDAQ